MKTADEYAGSAGRVPLGEPSASGEAGPDGSGDQSRPVLHSVAEALQNLYPNSRYFAGVDPLMASSVRELLNLPSYKGVPVEEVKEIRASKALDMINQRCILIERAGEGEQIGVPDWDQPPAEIDRMVGDLRALHRRQMQEIVNSMHSSMVRGIATCTGSRAEYLMAGHADRLRQRSISWGGVVVVGTMVVSALLSGIGAMVTLNFVGQAAGWW